MEMKNDRAHLEDRQYPKKLNIGLHMTEEFHSSVSAQEKWKFLSTQNLFVNVQSVVIGESQNLETTQMPINWWMDNQHMVYSCNEIQLNKNELWRHLTTWVKLTNNAEQEKPEAKDYILYDSIYITFALGKTIETNRSVLAWG